MGWVKIIVNSCKVLIMLGILEVATGNLIPTAFYQLGILLGKSMLVGGKS